MSYEYVHILEFFLKYRFVDNLLWKITFLNRKRELYVALIAVPNSCLRRRPTTLNNSIFFSSALTSPETYSGIDSVQC